jgi:cellulose synthase/poly-beta-1,6-N-acetylglucosamine synthase-like glycosyltransferase
MLSFVCLTAREETSSSEEVLEDLVLPDTVDKSHVTAARIAPVVVTTRVLEKILAHRKKPRAVAMSPMKHHRVETGEGMAVEEARHANSNNNSHHGNEMQYLVKWKVWAHSFQFIYYLFNLFIYLFIYLLFIYYLIYLLIKFLSFLFSFILSCYFH